MRMLARIRHRLTQNATQNATARLATAMNGRGETSNDVSETIRPKAMQLNIIAKKSRDR